MLDSSRQNTVCFTGHRPEKLTRSEQSIKLDLEAQIRIAINNGASVFISGMARGTDIWAAQIVLMLRDSGLPIRLLCACPYNGFEKGWRMDWQRQYNDILAAADSVHYICNSHSRSCFQTRNKWMADRSSTVIAVFNGKSGGTKNTIAYAEKTGASVIHIEG